MQWFHNFFKTVQIYKYLIGRLMLNFHHAVLDIFRDLFHSYGNIYDHSTRQRDHYNVPLYWTEIRCVAFVTVDFWYEKKSLRHNYHM